MRMYPVELPPVRRKKLNFRDHARRSWAMTVTAPTSAFSSASPSPLAVAFFLTTWAIAAGKPLKTLVRPRMQLICLSDSTICQNCQTLQA